MTLDVLSDEELLTLKRNLKNEVNRYKTLQNAVKVSLNSLYGTTASPYFMFYDKRCAEAITYTGQTVIKLTAHVLNQYFNKILNTDGVDYVKLIDTDSVTVWCKPLLDKFLGTYSDSEATAFLSQVYNDQVIPHVMKHYKAFQRALHAKKETLGLKTDSISSRSIYLAKKRYIYYVQEAEGVRYTIPKIKMMGIEAVKSSTPYVVREALEDCIKTILTKDKSDVEDFIDDFKAKFMKLPVNEVAFPRKLGNMTKYVHGDGCKPKTQMHIRAAIIYNRLLRQSGLDASYPQISNDANIRFIELKKPNPVKEDVIGFVDFIPKELEERYDLKKYYDYHTQFEKSFMSPICVIMNEAGMPLNEGGVPSLFD